MEKIVLLSLFALIALAIGGILKIGIYIGAKRATGAILAGFEYQVSDWEELTYQKTKLEELKQKQKYFLSIFKSYSLYNLEPIARQMNLENIGSQLHTIAYIEGQLDQAKLDDPFRYTDEKR